MKRRLNDINANYLRMTYMLITISHSE